MNRSTDKSEKKEKMVEMVFWGGICAFSFVCLGGSVWKISGNHRKKKEKNWCVKKAL